MSSLFFFDRIQVNDQVIEVDGQSLVGVTQAYAASVLRGTSGLVRFMIGREKDSANSEIAHLISQSIQAEKQRESQLSSFDEAPNKALPRSPEPMDTPNNTLQQPDLMAVCSKLDSKSDICPDYGEAGRSGLCQQNGSDWQERYSYLNEEFLRLKERTEERIHVLKRQLEDVQVELGQKRSDLELLRKDSENMKRILDDTKGQLTLLEKKYAKAKRIIKGYQQRENGVAKKEGDSCNQNSERDREHRFLVTALKDRILLLEGRLYEVQKAAGIVMPPETCLEDVLRDFEQRNQSEDGMKLAATVRQWIMSPANDVTAPEYENLGNYCTGRGHTKSELECLAHSGLLDSSAAKTKAILASRGSLAHRQPPSLRRQSSGSSIDNICDSSDSSPIRTSTTTRPLSAPNQNGAVPPDSLYLNPGANGSSSLSNDAMSTPSSYASQSPNPITPSMAQAQKVYLSPTSSSSSPCLSSPEKYSDSQESAYKCHVFCGTHVIDWSADEVCLWLSSVGLDVYSATFKGNGITGQALLQLDSSQLKVRREGPTSKVIKFAFYRSFISRWE